MSREANDPPRVFLLSPANCGGERARMLMRPQASFELAMQLRTPKGATIGDVFSFLSGLYFRGKLTYAQHFGASSYVITTSGGLMPADTYVTIDQLRAMAAVPIHTDEPR